MPKVPESKINQQIVEFLNRVGCFAWRNNTGAMKTARGGFVRFGMKGSSDVIGCCPDGRFLAIENKSNGEPLSASQREFLQMVKARGGVAATVTSLDEVVELFKAEIDGRGSA
jgi:hypothetical protein